VLYLLHRPVPKKAGLDVKNPLRPWSQSDHVARSSRDSGNVQAERIASDKRHLACRSWGLQYNSCGASCRSRMDWSSLQASLPSIPKLLHFYKTLYKTPDGPAEGRYSDGEPYATGKIAMMACGSWSYWPLKNDSRRWSGPTMVAEFPSVDGDPTKPLPTRRLTLTVDSKSIQKQDAARLIHYLLRRDPKIMASFFRRSAIRFTVGRRMDAADSQWTRTRSSDPNMKFIATKIVPLCRH